MDIQVAAARYLQSLRATGYSAFTTASISSCLGLFSKYVGEREIEDAGEYATAFLAEYSEHVKRNSLCTSYSHLKGWLRFCVRQGWLVQSPLEGQRGPRPEVVITVPLSDSDILGILDHCKQWERAAIILLLGSGMRIGELAALRWQDLGEGVLLLHGKGGKQRTVAPGVMAMRELVRLPREDERVFPRSVGAIKIALRRAGERAGVNAHPHRIRHTFAHRFMDASGEDITALSSILGHSSITTTMIYLQGRREKVLDAQRRYNPADALFRADKTLDIPAAV